MRTRGRAIGAGRPRRVATPPGDSTYSGLACGRFVVVVDVRDAQGVLAGGDVVGVELASEIPGASQVREDRVVRGKRERAGIERAGPGERDDVLQRQGVGGNAEGTGAEGTGVRRQLRARAARDDVHLRGGGGRGGYRSVGRRCAKNEQPRDVPPSAECLRGERAGKTHRARSASRARCRRRPGATHASRRVRDARIDRPTARLASGPTVSGPPRGAYRGVGSSFRCCARRASGKKGLVHFARSGVATWRATAPARSQKRAQQWRPLSPPSPSPGSSPSLALIAAPRDAPSWSSQARRGRGPRSSTRSTSRKTRRWRLWTTGGLASTVRAGRAPTSRARNLLHIHRARARIVRHSRISATLAPSSRSPRDEKAPCASRLSALRRPLTPSPPPSTSQRIRRRTPRRTTSS